MDLDDHVCLCFHVSKRKLLAHLRINKPKVAAQMADCGGAGTGCGWCVPYLKKLFHEGRIELPTADDYAAKRAAYRESGARTDATADS